MVCRGDEPHLEQNIEAILNQSYPKFRVMIVTDTKEDPAYSIADVTLKRFPTTDARLLTADAHPRASGKVAALLTALERDNGRSEAYAFVDSDALTSNYWLRDMVDPLADSSIGATTGFRWYVPDNGGFWSQVESAWNASGTNLMFSEKYNFPWGGAMTILRDKMNETKLSPLWETAVSDDLSLNQALRSHNYRIYFLPQCTVITRSQAAAQNFLKWATRQIVITRIYNHRLWSYGLGAYGFFTVLSVFGIAALFAGIASSPKWFLPAALLLAPEMLGVFRSSQRIRTFKRALPEFALVFKRNHWATSIASLFVPWIMAYCIIKSARMNDIEWRGRKYKLNGTEDICLNVKPS
jgi:hypothetical protein